MRKHTDFRVPGILCIAIAAGVAIGVAIGCSDWSEHGSTSPPPNPNIAEAIPSKPVVDLSPGIAPYLGIRVDGSDAQPTFGFKDRWGVLHCRPWYTIEAAQRAADVQHEVDYRMN